MDDLTLDHVVLRYCRQIIMQAMDHVRSRMRNETLPPQAARAECWNLLSKVNVLLEFVISPKSANHDGTHHLFGRDLLTSFFKSQKGSFGPLERTPT